MSSEGAGNSKDNSQIITFGSAVIVLSAAFTIYPHCVLGLICHFIVWMIFIGLIERGAARTFTQAFWLNALFTIIFVIVQSHYFPESYGATSPYSSSQTDDSYFFSLIADAIPAGLDTRPFYYLYSSGYTDLIRIVTPVKIYQPLDILFFQSGIAALLAVYAVKVTTSYTASCKAARVVYWLSLASPLLLMNGGVILMRDTFVAAVFLLSINCAERRRHWLLMFCILFQFYLRLGTALILLGILGILFSGEIMNSLKRLKIPRAYLFAFIGACILVCVAVSAYERITYKLSVDSDVLQQLQYEVGKVSLTGRVYEADALGIEAGGGGGAFAWISRQPLPARLFLAPVYMILNPFLSFRGAYVDGRVDLRLIGLNVVYPFLAFFVHAWVIMYILCIPHDSLKERRLLIAYVVGCLVVGIYSMQSRHKVILEPLYYVMAAKGCVVASPPKRAVGYILSGSWLIVQSIYYSLY